MYKKRHCSPRRKNKISCLPEELLLKIAKILNSKKKCKINTSCSKKALHLQICKDLNKLTECKDELCWGDFLKSHLNVDEYEIFTDSFKPPMPLEWNKNPNSWLSTDDINNVMEQYQNKYPKFKYMGAHPIDFALKKNNQCIGDDLCSLNINEMKKDYNSLGMVFNTDPHNEGGEHWFSVYVDMKGNNLPEPTIYYFDSALSKPSKEIINLVNKIKKQDPSFDFLFNDIKHQKGDTECGIYCLHFLTEMLKGKKFQTYIDKRLNDKQMEKYRKKFFIKK